MKILLPLRGQVRAEPLFMHGEWKEAFQHKGKPPPGVFLRFERWLPRQWAERHSNRRSGAMPACAARFLSEASATHSRKVCSFHRKGALLVPGELPFAQDFDILPIGFLRTGALYRPKRIPTPKVPALPGPLALFCYRGVAAQPRQQSGFRYTLLYGNSECLLEIPSYDFAALNQIGRHVHEDDMQSTARPWACQGIS